jgi:hypothetical protein
VLETIYAPRAHGAACTSPLMTRRSLGAPSLPGRAQRARGEWDPMPASVGPHVYLRRPPPESVSRSRGAPDLKDKPPCPRLVDRGVSVRVSRVTGLLAVLPCWSRSRHPTDRRSLSPSNRRHPPLSGHTRIAHSLGG